MREENEKAGGVRGRGCSFSLKHRSSSSTSLDLQQLIKAEDTFIIRSFLSPVHSPSTKALQRTVSDAFRLGCQYTSRLETDTNSESL
jgi:hypothetical protein